MRYRKFGRTNLLVSELGLGCSRLGGNLLAGNSQEAIKLLHQARDFGINFFDTADSYGQGQSEKLLGTVFKGNRSEVIFATKAGYSFSSLGRFGTFLKPLVKPVIRKIRSSKNVLQHVRASALQQNFDPTYIKNSIEGSLTRLGTDYIDLFQLHSPSVKTSRIDDLAALLEKMKVDGKIRCYGVSCAAISDALFWMNSLEIDALQVPINWFEKSAAQSVLPKAVSNNVAVVARQPFASGKIFDSDLSLPEQQKIESYRELAQSHNISLPHLALKDVLQTQGVSVTIVGANTSGHLSENLKITQSDSLSESLVSHMNDLAISS